MLPKIVLTLDCLNKLFQWSQKFCKFSAFSLKFQNFFSITRTTFSRSRSKQFWWQNTICFYIKIKGKYWIDEMTSRQLWLENQILAVRCSCTIINLNNQKSMEMSLLNTLTTDKHKKAIFIHMNLDHIIATTSFMSRDLDNL